MAATVTRPFSRQVFLGYFITRIAQASEAGLSDLEAFQVNRLNG
jgi:hypothetical protein